MGGGQDNDKKIPGKTSERGEDRDYTKGLIPPDYTEANIFGHPDELPIEMSVLNPDSAIDHPSHYNRGKIETIDFIEDRQHLGFARLNAIKYIDRSGSKKDETKEQSLRKAIWYLEREMGMHRKGEL